MEDYNRVKQNLKTIISNNSFDYDELKNIQESLRELNNILKNKLTCTIKATSSKVYLTPNFDFYEIDIFGGSINIYVSELPPTGIINVTLYEKCSHVPAFSVFYKDKCISDYNDFQHSTIFEIAETTHGVRVFR